MQNFDSFMQGLTAICDLYHYYTATSEKNEKKYSSLTPEQQELVTKIYEGLVRVARKPKTDPDRYTITFRQSKSWRKVQKDFNTHTIDTSWAQNWGERIALLNGEQTKIFDIVERYQQKVKDSEKANTKQLINIKKEISSLEKEYLDSQKKINQQIIEADKELQRNITNRTLMQQRKCKEIIDYIRENWLHLTVFDTWLDVPMNAEKLFVKIKILPSKSVPIKDEDILEAVEDEDILPVKDENVSEFAKDVNVSTRAIFCVQEKELKEITVKDKDSKPVKITLPTELIIEEKNTAFGPPPPSPEILITEAQILFGEDFDYTKDDSFRKYAPANANLQTVVDQAIEKFNQVLKNGDTSLIKD